MAILVIVFVLLLAGLIYQSIASRRDREKYPAPGVLVRTDLGQIHLHNTGQGDATVVIEAALGDSSLDWTIVQSKVAQFTRVCTYDRAGLGWSTPAAGVLSSDQIADNLRQALKGARISGPYIFVGHSIGGIYARASARLKFEDVVGLVLVDSAHENQRHRLPPETMKEGTMIKGLASVLRVLAPIGIPRALKLADRLQGDNFPDEIRPAAVARMNQSHFFKALFNEVKQVELNTAQTAPPANLGDIPLVVISRGGENPGLPEAEFERLKQSWDELQRDLVELSSNSQHIIAEKSGHYIHHDQPDLVVGAIRQLVENNR
jgi:pimeloyl-ACP methyl ester carboxylesterase